MHHKLAILGAVLFAGFLISSYITSPVVCFSLCAASAAAAVLLKGMKPVLLALAGLAAAFMIYGIYTLVYIAPVRSLYGQTRDVTAVVKDVEYTGNDKVLITVNADANGVPLRFSFFFPDIGIDEGDRIRAAITLSEPSVTAAYSEDHNYSRGIFTKAAVCELQSVEKDTSFSVVRQIRSYSRRLRDITAEELPGEEGGLLLAMCYGDKSRLDPALSVSVTNCGLAHLTAVSGMHISLIFSIFMSFPAGLFIRKHRAAGCASVLILAAVLTVFFNLTPSVCRSCIMLIIYYSSKWLRRKHSTSNALGLAAVIILLAEPCACRDPGLMLSFCGTAAAGVLAQSALRHLKHMRSEAKTGSAVSRKKQALFSAIAVSIFASLCTLPVSSVIFGRFSLVSVPAAIITAPLFFGAVILAVATALTGGLLAPVALLPAGLIVKVMIAVMRFLGGYRFSSIRLDGSWNTLFFAVSAVFLAAVLFIASKLRRHGKLVSVCVFCTVICVFASLVTAQRLSDKDVTRIRIYSDGKDQVTAVENETGISAFSTGVNKKLASAAYRMLCENGADGFELLAVLERKKRRSIYSGTFEEMKAREKHFLNGSTELYDISGSYSVLVSDSAICMDVNGVTVVLTDADQSDRYPGNDISVYSGSSPVRDTGSGITVFCGRNADSSSDTYNAYYSKTEILISKDGRIAVKS